jgi:hypothetical protein
VCERVIPKPGGAGKSASWAATSCTGRTPRRARRSRTRSVPSTRRPTRAAIPGGAHVQRGHVRRDRALRELPGPQRTIRLQPAGAQDPTLDADDSGCVPGTDSLLVKINGCFSPDPDYDGQSYRLDWPGTNPNVALDRALHPSAVRFTSPLTRGRNYPRSRSRPTCPGSRHPTRRPTRRSATGRRARTA